MKGQHLYVLIPQSVHKALKIAAAEEETNMNRLVARAIENFLEGRASDATT